jgi:hypothetical protein
MYEFTSVLKGVLENTEDTIKKGNQKEQSRETGNIGYTRRRKKPKAEQNMSWTPVCTNKHTHTHTHTHTPQTIYAPPPPQATGGKNELNIVLMRKS